MKETDLLDALAKIHNWCENEDCQDCILYLEKEKKCKLDIDGFRPQDWKIEIKRKLIL